MDTNIFTYPSDYPREIPKIGFVLGKLWAIIPILLIRCISKCNTKYIYRNQYWNTIREGKLLNKKLISTK